jgi:hypothetical protein
VASQVWVLVHPMRQLSPQLTLQFVPAVHWKSQWSVHWAAHCPENEVQVGAQLEADPQFREHAPASAHVQAEAVHAVPRAASDTASGPASPPASGALASAGVPSSLRLVSTTEASATRGAPSAVSTLSGRTS